MVRFLAPAGRRVIEIGPGGGVLTRELLDAGARVLAVELDPEWSIILARRVRSAPVTVIVGDASRLSWSRLPKGTLVTGNLPFQISTSLISALLPHHSQVPRAAFLVQQEVADRLLARPGDPAYGALSVLTAARARVSLLGRVARGSFHPPPKVDAAFVGLELREPPLAEAEMAAFTATVRLAFARRRKQLRNALAVGWGRAAAERTVASVGLDRKCRAEQLDLTEFLELHRGWRQGLPRPPEETG